MFSFMEYVTEAALSHKSNRGGRKWEQVKDDINNIDFEIEKKRTDSPIMNKYGETLALMQPGESLKILSDEELEIDGETAVYIKNRRGEEGWMYLKNIRNPGPKSTTSFEDKVLEMIKKRFDQIVNDQGPFTLYLDGRHKMDNIVDIMQPDGDPKADYVIYDDKKRPVGFISHKKGGGASGFQQYGGISQRSGFQKYGTREMVDEIDDFIKAVRDHKMKNPNLRYRMYRPVENEDIIRFAVYGRNYKNNFGLHNVNIIGQGYPIIDVKGNKVNLSFNETVHHNPDVSWALKGEYRAIFMARNAGGRPLKCLRCDAEVPKTRGGIFPYAYLNSTSVEV